MKYSILYLLFICMLYLACDSDSSTGILINYDVDYIVEGTADSITIQYRAADGNMVTVTNVIPNWTYRWTRKGVYGDTVSISAQATDTVVRYLKVGILTNGSVLDTVSTTGPGTISVSLTMTLP
ncbi:MAG: hypothetical protein ISS16_12400 [Ignavibacteria bacterium]|nr:hypothetical protein [Ignavibacteria bacterium]